VRITSTRNPLIQHVRTLQRASVRRAEGLYLIEGVRLVREAVATRQSVHLVLYDPDLLRRSAAGSLLLRDLPRWAERRYEVDARVLSAAAQTEHPAGVLAVLRREEPAPLASHHAASFGVVLDGVADPGNAGAIARTSAAAGVDYLVAVSDTVDLFGPKVVRAGMGAHFRVPVYTNLGWDRLVADLSETAFVAIDAGGEASIYDFEWPARTALVVGGEAHGLSAQAERCVAQRVRIPMKDGVESLNAAVAASIAMYAALGPSLPECAERYR